MAGQKIVLPFFYHQLLLARIPRYLYGFVQSCQFSDRFNIFIEFLVGYLGYAVTDTFQDILCRGYIPLKRYDYSFLDLYRNKVPSIVFYVLWVEVDQILKSLSCVAQ